MVYTMVIQVDGGCRGNGQPGAYGAAAAVILGRKGRILKTWTRELPSYQYPLPTNQRAEISAIMLALQLALDKYNNLSNQPYMDVTIESDSRYAVECMNTWIHKWASNGWRNARGTEVANQDLIREASDLDDRLRECGSVTYEWISRWENEDADAACNERMDRMYSERMDRERMDRERMDLERIFRMCRVDWDFESSDSEYW